MRNACRILAEKREDKKTWQDNIKINLKETVWLDGCASGKGPW
jgi:hypothetical protein